MSSDVRTLSAGQVRALVEAKLLSPLPVSPFTNVLRGRAAAEPLPEVSDFAGSLELLARPDAYVRIVLTRPDGEEIIGLLTRDGIGASFSVDEHTVGFGRAQPLEALVTSLASSLTHPAAPPGGEIWLWPSAVRLATGLWQEQPDPEVALSSASVIARLVTPDFSPPEAEQFIAAAIATGVIEARGEDLVLSPSLRPWLALVWSGHAVQIEHVPLRPTARLERAIEGRREHLLFIGPPGARALNEVVEGAALRAHLGGRPREPSMLHLVTEATEQIAARLRVLLKLPPA